MAAQDSPALQTVRAFHAAWTGGDVEAATRHLAEDVVVHAPGERVEGRTAYGEFLAGFVPMLTGAPLIDEFAEGDRAVLLYYPQTAAAADLPAAEHFTVRGGEITEIVLVFDRLSYGPPPRA